MTSGNSLTIYAQTTDEAHMGKLTVNDSKQSKYAPLGGEKSSKTAGTITINGGKITATLANKSRDGAAIGGFGSGGAGTITVNGGIVTADASISNGTQAAIGFGDGGKGGTVTINGGQVSAKGPSGGCGIGADSISLSYTNPTDSIYATSYYNAPTLEKDFIIEGTETDATPTNIAGKTIVPKPAPLTVYSITYDLDDGEVANANPTEYTVETETFTLNNPTREGYVFAGWSGTGIDGTAMVVTVEKGSEGDRAYKANWEKATCTVTITEGEGYEIRAIAVLAGDGESEGETIPVTNGSTVEYGAVLDVTVTATPAYNLESAVAQMGEQEIDLLEVSTVTVNHDISISANVKMKYFSLETIKHDNGAEPVVSCSDYPIGVIPYGTEVSVTAGEANEGYEFIGFYRTNGVLLTKETTYSFTLISYPEFEIRYQAVSAKVVTFISNGQVVATKTIGADAAFTENDFPAAPSAVVGYEFTGWSMTADEINAALANGNVTVNAEFKMVEKSINVLIYNGENEDPEETDYDESTIITVTAEEVEGKNFAYWLLDNETIISYNPTLTYFVTTDVVLTAVYSTETVEPAATATLRTANYNVNTRKLTVNVYLNLPSSDCTVLKAGLIAVSAESSFEPETQTLTDELTLETGTVYKKFLASANGKHNAVDYTWNKGNVLPGDTWYVRARLSYKDENGVEQVVYGPMIKVVAGTDYDYEEKGTATIEDYYYNPDTNKATFIAYLAAPEGGVIVKAGLVATPKSDFEVENEILTSSNAKYVKSLASAVGKSKAVSYTWNKTNANQEDEWYARAWLVYTLDGATHTVYGDLVTVKTV